MRLNKVLSPSVICFCLLGIAPIVANARIFLIGFQQLLLYEVYLRPRI